MPSTTGRVLIIYRFLPHYRAEFYSRLRENLAARGIELDLIYGESEKERLDKVALPWATFKASKSFRIGGFELLWQPCLREALEYDLVIVEQANRLLLNYVLLLARRFWGFRLAFWGHGLNWQSPERSLVNRFKVAFLRLPDWWFAYTEGVARILEARGYRRDRITVVHNSIDLRKLKEQLADPKYSIPDWLQGKPTALFCGGMYKEKRLDFLLSCCDRIKEQVAEFQMLFIGAGNEHHKISLASKARPWMHDLGPLTGAQKIPYLKAAQLFLMPGLVGLVVLDSFAAGAPMVTTDYPFHSPEIDYLVHGTNGLMVKDAEFVEAVVSLFNNKDEWKALREGCLASANLYSLEKMVESFEEGIASCLASTNGD